MKILLAADGSSYTKKALAFLVNHEGLAGPDGELVVLNVQPTIPPQVHAMVGSKVVDEYQAEEAAKVLAPIEEFLKRHKVNYRASWVAGYAPSEIVAAGEREKSQLIVMGTHGHGLAGRILLGSVAQNVVARCEVPVLLVK